MKKFLPISLAYLLGVFSSILTASAIGGYAEDFDDVSGTEWYAEAVQELSGMGIIEGYDDGTFRPNDSANRAEIATMFSRYDGIVGDDLNSVMAVICNVIASDADLSGDDYYGDATDDYEKICPMAP